MFIKTNVEVFGRCDLKGVDTLCIYVPCIMENVSFLTNLTSV